MEPGRSSEFRLRPSNRSALSVTGQQTQKLLRHTLPLDSSGSIIEAASDHVSLCDTTEV